MNFSKIEGHIIAIIRVRGRRSIKPRINHTLKLFRLHRTNHAVVMKATKPTIGMLKIAKDYVAFGKISKEVLEQVIEKRGEIGQKKSNETVKSKDVAEAVFEGKRLGDFIDPVFRLHPPRKGWKTVKNPSEEVKDENIDPVIKRMI
jgi:large subunit ribosomal protein L30